MSFKYAEFKFKKKYIHLGIIGLSFVVMSVLFKNCAPVGLSVNENLQQDSQSEDLDLEGPNFLPNLKKTRVSGYYRLTILESGQEDEVLAALQNSGIRNTQVTAERSIIFPANEAQVIPLEQKLGRLVKISPYIRTSYKKSDDIHPVDIPTENFKIVGNIEQDSDVEKTRAIYGSSKLPLRSRLSNVNRKLSGGKFEKGESGDSSTDNSALDYFPNVIHQGRYGSCLAHSAGYYLNSFYRSYYAAFGTRNVESYSDLGDLDRSPNKIFRNDTRFVCRPMSVYWLFGVGGQNVWGAVTALSSLGCSSFQEYQQPNSLPEDELNFKLNNFPNPTFENFESALNSRQNLYDKGRLMRYDFDSEDSAEIQKDINEIKGYLLNGHIFLTTMKTDSGFKGMYVWQQGQRVLVPGYPESMDYSKKWGTGNTWGANLVRNKKTSDSGVWLESVKDLDWTFFGSDYTRPPKEEGLTDGQQACKVAHQINPNPYCKNTGCVALDPDCHFAGIAEFRGGHAVTLVGFDNSKTYTIDGSTRSGALLFANSWGNGWGRGNLTAERNAKEANTSLPDDNKGFFWVSEYALVNKKITGFKIYTLDVGLKPETIAYIKIPANKNTMFFATNNTDISRSILLDMTSSILNKEDDNAKIEVPFDITTLLPVNHQVGSPITSVEFCGDAGWGGVGNANLPNTIKLYQGKKPNQQITSLNNFAEEVSSDKCAIRDQDQNVIDKLTLYKLNFQPAAATTTATPTPTSTPTATPTPVLLTVNISGNNGSGSPSVVITGGGEAQQVCTAAPCPYRYRYNGPQITLTADPGVSVAVPGANITFKNWNGCDNVSATGNTCFLTMPLTDKTVTAEFCPPYQTFNTTTKTCGTQQVPTATPTLTPTPTPTPTPPGLTVKLIPGYNSGGRVSVTGGGESSKDCYNVSSCFYRYPISGLQITFKAVPGPNSAVKSWDGCSIIASAADTCVLPNMPNRDTTVTAYFCSPNQIFNETTKVCGNQPVPTATPTLTPTPTPTPAVLTVYMSGYYGGNSSIFITGGDGTTKACTSGPCSYRYPKNGVPINLTAILGANVSFKNWDGCSSSKDSPTACVLTMPSTDTSVTANFCPQYQVFNAATNGCENLPASTPTPTLTPTPTPVGLYVYISGYNGGNPSVSVSGGGQPSQSCTGPCFYRYPSGSQITLTAKPVGNIIFSQWSEGCSSKPSPDTCVITMPTMGNSSMTAKFTCPLGQVYNGSKNLCETPSASTTTPKTLYITASTENGIVVFGQTIGVNDGGVIRYYRPAYSTPSYNVEVKGPQATVSLDYRIDGRIIQAPIEAGGVKSYKFIGWRCGRAAIDPTSSTCTLTMDTNKSAVAIFSEVN